MIRPLLAASIDTEEELAQVLKQHGELYVSEKRDGIRASVSSGRLWSREAKLIRNIHLQKYFRHLPDGVEGELMFWIDGLQIHPPLEHINSIVTSNDEWPKRWTPMFHAFDYPTYQTASFRDRYEMLKRQEGVRFGFYVEPQYLVDNLCNIIRQFEFITDNGGEGICLRNPNARYKEGRATLKGGELMRFKKLTRDVAVICGYTLLECHVGEQKRNAFGLAKRDSKKSNLKEQPEIGALIGIHETLGKFKVGSGFTSSQRQKLYLKRDSLPGKKFIFEFRDTTYQGVPRNATFKEFV